MHHIGSQEVKVVIKPKEPKVEEVQECLDHRPNSFKKGKPWSILSLPLIFANLSNYIMMVILPH
jgi:hypothetical protein